MRSMIWSAVLVHLKGRALAFQNLIQFSSGLQPERPPDAVDAGRGDADLPGQLPLGPVRGALGGPLPGCALPPPPPARRQWSAARPGGGSSPSPSSRLARKRARHLVTVPRFTRSRGDGDIGAAVRAGQDDPRPQRQPLRGFPPLRPVLRRPPPGLGQHQRLKPAITHTASRPREPASRNPRPRSPDFWD
jgi:hypothetical protein